MIVSTFASPQKLARKLASPLARLAIVGLCASLSLTSARADGDETAARTPPRQALDHYNRGRAHYQAGRYQEAVVELERALELDPDSPNLVYNLARIYELLADIDRSIAYYRRYRGMLPASETEERARVDSTLQRLQGAKSQPLREPETRTVPVLVPMERGVADGAFWTLATLSLAALAAGSVTGGLALRAEHQTRDFVLGQDGNLRERNHKAEAADRLALASDISVASGAVGALTSALLYALRSHPVVAPELTVVQHGAGLSLRGEL
ncbi:MAG: hypothetical protein JWN48_4053 [Myxococcaceae bacterium]|nr:hypothetical protein [Myxococcaceae bacterium]